MSGSVSKEVWCIDNSGHTCAQATCAALRQAASVAQQGSPEPEASVAVARDVESDLQAHAQCHASLQLHALRRGDDPQPVAQCLKTLPLLKRVRALAPVAPQPHLMVARNEEDHAKLGCKPGHRCLEDLQAVCNISRHNQCVVAMAGVAQLFAELHVLRILAVEIGDRIYR